MNSNNRFARLLFAAVAVPTLILAVSTAPANAVVADTDAVKLSGPDAAFGTGALGANGVPAGSGRVDYNVAGGLTTPSMIGTLYVSPGICARVRLESYDTDPAPAHVLIDDGNGSSRCGVVGGLNQWSVNLSNIGHQDTTHVHPIVQTFSGGIWSTYRNTTTNLGD